MQKELNPELFGEKRLVDNLNTSVVGETLAEPDFLNIDLQILDLKNSQQKVLVQTADHAKGTNLKLERLQQQLTRLEVAHNQLVQEIGQRLNQMQQRIVERASYDEKTREMFDRHNQVLQSFEAKVMQLQRHLAEREAQLGGALQTLNDAKMEIARLKRN